MTESCGFCGIDPAKGYATLNAIRFCHGDEDTSPTCYERAQALGVPEVDALVTMPAMRARLDELLARSEERG